MRVYKPFTVKGIDNSDDSFIPARVKCAGCGTNLKLTLIDVFFIEVAYQKLYCYACNPDGWDAAFNTLSSEHRTKEPIKVDIKL